MLRCDMGAATRAGFRLHTDALVFDARMSFACTVPGNKCLGREIFVSFFYSVSGADVAAKILRGRPRTERSARAARR